jgi:hypothetical protein
MVDDAEHLAFDLEGLLAVKADTHGGKTSAALNSHTNRRCFKFRSLFLGRVVVAVDDLVQVDHEVG